MGIRWTKSLAVGIEAIDEQHKELFRRTGAFLDGLEGRSRQEVGILLSYLRTYAVTHFGEEEEAMRESGDPGYEAHREEHDRFIREILALSREQEKPRGAGVAPGELGKRVRGWLADHVSRTDRAMVSHLLARGKGKKAGKPAGRGKSAEKKAARRPAPRRRGRGR